MSPPADSRPSLWRRGLRLLFALLLMGGLMLVGLGWRAFGKSADGQRRARMDRSAQFKDGRFVNRLPLFNDYWGWLPAMFEASEDAAPKTPLPVVATDPAIFETPPESGLRVTWLGHSTLLLEIDGQRILTDPIWSERSSPFSFAGPKRWYPPPLALSDLPPLDAVVFSHDHYDHLDVHTVEKLSNHDTRFVAPLGVGAHLAYWGVPAERIDEMDWGDSKRIGQLAIHCTQARHASGRHLLDQNGTLWAGYAFVGPKHRVYFSGDTGLFPELADIGKTLGPFDLTLIEVGAYHKTWPDWHIGPEQAVRAHKMLRGTFMLPVHWGLFNLALHGWTEPIERTVAEARRQSVQVLVPKPGQSVEPGVTRTHPWWPKLRWQTAEEHPIRSTMVEPQKPKTSTETAAPRR